VVGIFSSVIFQVASDQSLKDQEFLGGGCLNDVLLEPFLDQPYVFRLRFPEAVLQGDLIGGPIKEFSHLQMV